MKKEKIIVLAGGTSSEREVSLRSGKNIHDALKRLGYHATIYDMDRDFFNFIINRGADLVFIALHGNPGEDGRVQGFLDLLDINYTGADYYSSMLCLNKLLSKNLLRINHIPTPDWYKVSEKDFEDTKVLSDKVFNFLGLPLICKPVWEGSSVGINIIHHASEILPVLEKTFKEFRNCFVEKFIKGKAVTVGIIEKVNQKIVLPVLELKAKNEFYDYEAKYTRGMTEFIIPAELEKQIYEKVQELALQSYTLLGCRDFARVDILCEESTDKVFVHDVNTIPGMTDLSDLPAEALKLGIKYDELIGIITENALTRIR